MRDEVLFPGVADRRFNGMVYVSFLLPEGMVELSVYMALEAV